RLDRSKYHSQGHGEFTDDVRYWQDGLPFDAQGHPVERAVSPPPHPPHQVRGRLSPPGEGEQEGPPHPSPSPPPGGGRAPPGRGWGAMRPTSISRPPATAR